MSRRLNAKKMRGLNVEILNLIKIIKIIKMTIRRKIKISTTQKWFSKMSQSKAMYQNNLKSYFN